MDSVPDFEIWDADNSGSGYTKLCYLKPVSLRCCTGGAADLLECEVVFDSNAPTPPAASHQAVNLRAHEWRSLPIGGGETLEIGHRVTFRCDTGSGDKLYFVGDFSNAIVGFDGGESLRLIFTSIKSRMADRTIYGQVVEAASEDDTLISGLPCVFNPGGRNNGRSETTTFHPFDPANSDPYSCFDVPADFSAQWTVSRMID